MKLNTERINLVRIAFYLSTSLFLLEILYLKFINPVMGEIGRAYLGFILIPPFICTFSTIILIYNNWFCSKRKISNNSFFKVIFYLLVFGVVLLWSTIIFVFVIK